MRIDASFDGDLKGISLNQEKQTGEKTVDFVFVCAPTEKEATKVFGRSFKELAEASTRGDGQPLFKNQLKPNLPTETHVVDIAGKRTDVTPSIDSFKHATVRREDGEGGFRKVPGFIVCLVLTAQFSPEIIKAVASKFGSPVEMTLAPKHLTMFDENTDDAAA